MPLGHAEIAAPGVEAVPRNEQSLGRCWQQGARSIRQARQVLVVLQHGDSHACGVGRRSLQALQHLEVAQLEMSLWAGRALQGPLG